jgi:hypothetical protein
MFNNSSKERRSSGDDGFAVFQNGNGRKKERPSVVPSSSAAPASAALHFRGTMDNNSTYPDDGTCLFARGVWVGLIVSLRSFDDDGFFFLGLVVFFQGG